MGIFKKIGKGLLYTGAIAGVSALIIKNRINEKQDADEEYEEYEKWQQEIEENLIETKKRKSIICEFDDILDEETFNNIIYSCARRIKRIDRIDINNGTISVTVISQSGISDWDFELDFNDYGKITGSYWISSDNYDSKIPEKLGDLIQRSIAELYNENT